MALTDYPKINGKMYGWASISLNIAGAELPGSVAMKGMRAISYKKTVERSPVYGSGREPIGYTKGKNAYEGSVTFVKEWAINLAATAGEGFMDQPMVFTVSYKEGDEIHTDTIQVVGMKEYGADHSEGPDGLETEIPLDILRIKFDGREATEPEDQT